jgi:hypothetical protein
LTEVSLYHECLLMRATNGAPHNSRKDREGAVPVREVREA